MIELINIKKSFKNKNNVNYVLKGINLKIDKDTKIGIMGKSGSGKSTLIRIILRLEKEDFGSVIFNGEILDNRKNKLKSYRKSVQFISQTPQTFFDPSIKIEKSLKEALRNFNYSDDLKSEYFLKILENLKLSESLLKRYPHQLSGGEIQRFSIARAISIEPEFLILDEATSMLDITIQAQILNLLKEIQEEKGIGLLVISHEKKVLDFMCDDIYELKNGTLKLKEGD